MYYTVIDFTFQIPKKLGGVWTRFKEEKSRDSIFKISFLRSEALYGMEYSEALRLEGYFVRYEEDIMLADKQWKNAYLFSLRKPEHLKDFICQLFCTYTVQHHIVYFHSSLIDYRGQGIMFLGPSGVGKTTQAELWNKYRDAVIINGDRVFVQEREDGFLGWGSPWHGSSPYCENANVPINALIILKQDSENFIRELTGFEKAASVSNNVLYPRWLENGMELSLETLDHLLKKIPVYELSGRPDEDAVKLTEEAVFGK